MRVKQIPVRVGMLILLIIVSVTSYGQVLPDLRVASIYLEDEKTYKPPASDTTVRAQVLIENLSGVDVTVPISVSVTARLASSPVILGAQPPGVPGQPIAVAGQLTAVAGQPIAVARQPMAMARQPIAVTGHSTAGAGQPTAEFSLHSSQALASVHPVILSRPSAPISISGGQTLTVSGTLTTGIQAYKAEYIDLIFPVGFPYTNATLQCTVDPDASIAESDENNNTRKEGFIVERKLSDMKYSARIDSLSDLVDAYAHPDPKVASFVVSYTNTSNRNITPYNSRGHCMIGNDRFVHKRIIGTGWYDIIPPNGHFKIEYYNSRDRKETKDFPVGRLSVSCENELMNWCRLGNCYDIWFQETVNRSIDNTYVVPPLSGSFDLRLHEIRPSGTQGSYSPPEASGNTWARVAVRGIGGAIPTSPAFSVTCKLLRNGNAVSTLSSPGAGGSEFDYHWFNFGRQSAGSYVLECEADPNNSLPDSDRSNNTMSTTLTISNN